MINFQEEISLVKKASHKRKRKHQHKYNQNTLTSISSIQINNTLEMFILQDNPISKECRICLDHSETLSKILISPCNCLGSLKYVHEECHFKWFQHRFFRISSNRQKKRVRKEGLQCQLCKMKLLLVFQDKSGCNSLDQFKIELQKYLSMFIFLLIFIFIDIGVLTFVIAYAINHHFAFDFNVMADVIIFISVFFMIIVLMLSIYEMLAIFLIKKQNKIVSIGKKPEINSMDNRLNQVIPQIYQS